jgi:hypothetical protein
VRSGFYRVVVTVAAVFFVLALLGIARIGWALAHGSVWVNYRGSVLSHAQMYVALALSVTVALGSVAIGWIALLSGRSQGRP